ncbi:putative reverse transcriptase domain-containing protein [Tanacetum coccineum]
MPPRRLRGHVAPRRSRRAAMERLIADRVAKAIDEHERNRPNSDNAEGSTNVQGCSHKTFMNGKPHSFNGTEGVVGLRRWIEKVEQVFGISKCAKQDKVMFAASTFEGRALTWWNGNVHTLGLANANRDDIEAYNNRFHELALMCPELVPNERKKVESNNNNNQQQQNKRQETTRAYAVAPVENRGYAGNLPRCNRCNSHHNGQCPPKCQKCQRVGHLEKDCRAGPQGVGVTPLQDVVCYGCGDKGNYKNKCPKGRNHPNDGAHARAYVVVENAQQNPNVVTGTFLLNDHYASILFDSGAEKSFVSTEFTPFINIAPATLDTSYEVELADGKVVSTNTVLRGCTLVLYNHCFKIDLLPTRLGSFDVIVGMDWLSYHCDVIVCYEKIVRIPLSNGEILEIQGERPEKDLKLLSCIKADEKKLDDIRIVRDFPEVFPDDLTGLPPVREIEFCIDLIPGALPVVKSPYRLAPSEMNELSNQLKELQEKGFIRPSHSPWGAPYYLLKRKTVQ